MKYLKFLFILFTIGIIGFLTYLFSLKADITISKELNTDIPAPAAFKQLVLTTTHQPYFAQKALDSVRITFNYFKDKRPLKMTYRPIVDFNHYRLTFSPTSPPQTLQPFSTLVHTIQIQSLVDRSTNIHWVIHYRISGLTPRLLNRFFWQPQLARFLKRHMNELKNYFH